METKRGIREHIIEVTTELIEQYHGDTASITSRIIAEKAGIGLGLINYHFESKDKLITECVQRIIGTVTANFHMEQSFPTDKERLTACAAAVFDFLFEHAAISHISILGDFQQYTHDCNSVLTQAGFLRCLEKSGSEQERRMLVFALTAAMQAAFLGRETAKELLGYDFAKADERAAYIKKLITIFYEGMERGDE